MSILNSLWLASAIYLLALFGVALAVGISTAVGWLTFLLAGMAPILMARHFWRVPEPSLSQHIQRELR